MAGSSTHAVTAEELAAAHAKYAPPWMYPLLVLWLLLTVAMVLWSMFPRYDLYNRMGYRFVKITGFGGIAEKAVKKDVHERTDAGTNMRVHFESDTSRRAMTERGNAGMGKTNSEVEGEGMARSQTSSKTSSLDSKEGEYLGAAVPMLVVTAPDEPIVQQYQRGERGKRRNTLDSGWRKFE